MRGWNRGRNAFFSVYLVCSLNFVPCGVSSAQKLFFFKGDVL